MTPDAAPSTAPNDLPRLLMRRAGLVALAVLLLAVGLGLARVAGDIDEEVDAAMTLASLVARLGSLAAVDDMAALASLRQLQQDRPTRHLRLSVRAAGGNLLLAPPAAPPAPAALQVLLDLHRALLSVPDTRQVSWTLARPAGPAWAVTLAASHEAERKEAMLNLLGMLALLLACIAGLLLAVRWNLRRALAPLGSLLGAIARIGTNDNAALRALPVMPVGELEALAAALRHLAQALAAADAERRLLVRQALTLQEDERHRLARDLHDEFGQRLTALRVDAAWLARRVAGRAELASVVQGMAGQCMLLHQDIRQLLTRLQPFGPLPAGGGSAQEPLERLVALLRALVGSWARTGGDPPVDWQLELALRRADGLVTEWDAEIAALTVPRSLALVIYRISQEALTNVARHARARRAVLRLLFVQPSHGLADAGIEWSVADDGMGIDGDGASARGNGIAGIRERVWAQGGELCSGAAEPGAAQPGLRLSASFALPASGAVVQPAGPLAG